MDVFVLIFVLFLGALVAIGGIVLVFSILASMQDKD